MQYSLSTQIIALAGLCQALQLVQKVARSAETNNEALTTMLSSVAVLSADEPLQIYGNRAENLTTGLKLIVDQLGDKPQKDVELTRYVVGVLALERRLNKTPARLKALGDKLQHLQRQLQHFAITDDNMLANLADIYSECISSLGSRIQIYGQPDLLKQTAVQHKVRALLLAAIRSAVLWRQAGGSRLNFIFKRRKLVAQAQQMLSQLPSPGL
ncbi:MAG: high frequency lysogenization protein HflD [Gammaproteobacteria bacterium]|nr:high frequency lysogenization protein HflD [Gammaproteobacteria bacterium]MBU1553921.1 high frequency lysogenization protein HflD [Gammaproteobacteria bacterium]MBU2071260.1 high frequency lysogenization protein HflD [Gammaproteobacteria bacterium]MBU2181667.1 high frequency lysogenization protein HflD [Gammaproteobacteria bacterium]MBU2205345.1 high frequency lysogenization protein HflD [Gammaproteobacteria bacterium]